MPYVILVQSAMADQSCLPALPLHIFSKMIYKKPSPHWAGAPSTPFFSQEDSTGHEAVQNIG